MSTIGSCTSCHVSTAASRGLERTAEAIAKAENHFDQAASRVVDATERLTQGASDRGSSLVSEVAAVQVQSLQNELLYATYQRQNDQQKDLLQVLR